MNLQSTNRWQENDGTEDFFSEKTNSKTREVCTKVIDLSQLKGEKYCDLTGRFPYQSSRGNKYILVMYDYNSNSILQHPMKSREKKVFIDAWMTLHKTLEQNGHVMKKF